MKKIVSALLVVLMLVGLAACGVLCARLDKKKA